MTQGERISILFWGILREAMMFPEKLGFIVNVCNEEWPQTPNPS